MRGSENNQGRFVSGIQGKAYRVKLQVNFVLSDNIKLEFIFKQHRLESNLFHVLGCVKTFTSWKPKENTRINRAKLKTFTCEDT